MGDNAYIRIINTVEDLLNQLSNEAKKIDFRKNGLLKKLQTNVADPKNIEHVGIELVKFLKNIIRKIFQNLHFLENSIKEESVPDTVFETLLKEILELRLSNWGTDKYVLPVKGDKNSENNHLDRDDLNCAESLNCESFVSDVIELPPDNNVHEKDTVYQNIQNDSLLTKRNSLSLIKLSEISQETDDGEWEFGLSVFKKGTKLLKNYVINNYKLD